MFFEINNTVQDSKKLERKRLLLKKYIQQKIQEIPTITRIQNNFYAQETFQVIEIKIYDVEEYTQTHFTL